MQTATTPTTTETIAKIRLHIEKLVAERYARVLRAENRRMRDALLALDGIKVMGTAAEPGIGHAAFWAIVRRGPSDDNESARNGGSVD